VAAGAFVVTLSAREGAAEAGFDERDILACVLGLTPRDFYKSMAADKNPGLWQDVYRPTFQGTALYVKLQISAIDNAVVISFKEL
jgi:motility quorum-sensing regulator/GCU-specific mRNA interferase toxin